VGYFGKFSSYRQKKAITHWAKNWPLPVTLLSAITDLEWEEDLFCAKLFLP
jgi:hypothetical protein